MSNRKKDIAIRADEDVWPGIDYHSLALPGSFAVARATSERWSLRTDDGREIELMRREVHVAYRTQPLAPFRVTPAQAGWGLGFAGLVVGLIAIVAGVMTPNRSVAASALIDIPKPVAAAEPAPRVVVQTRYIVAPPLQQATPSATVDMGSTPDQGDARDVPTALRRAFATNEAQGWATGSVSGMVVVGAMQIEGGRQCRDVAILTRAVEGDSTVNDRYCQTGTGAIAVEPTTGE